LRKDPGVLPRRRGPLVGFLVGVAAIAVASLVLVPFRETVTVAGPALVFVLIVFGAAVVGGRRAATGIALVAAAVLHLVFTTPYLSPRIDLVSDIVAVVGLLVVALAVGSLVAAIVERTEEAVRQRDDAEAAHAQLREVMAERERLAADAARVPTLEAVDEQRRALLRSVSHDLRTPLATIRGVASDLRDGTDYEPAVRAELLDLVCDEAERLDRLVANLLSLSRIEAGSMAPVTQVLDLGELVAERVSRLRALFRQVRVQLDRPTSSLLVEGDHSQLQQVVTNLLENAARHAPQGSTVWVSVRAAAGGIELTVADEGAGVPERDRAGIFEPFRTGAGSRSSGIGLAICKAVVEAHDGTIEVATAPVGGARFRVWLPGSER
jgi:K+-sensing histidine kinase KdpD